MNNKEVCEWLKAIEEKYIHGGDEGFDELRHEALRRAVEIIESLEQESCEDAISRREAIKMFTYNYKGERIPDYDCDNFPVQIAMKTVKERLRALPPVNPAQKWIPCSERLPDKAVLCCGENGEMIIGYPYEDDDYYTGYCAENDGTILVDCVAWMPLPEPYKLEPQEKEK